MAAPCPTSHSERVSGVLRVLIELTQLGTVVTSSFEKASNKTKPEWERSASTAWYLNK